MRKECNLSMDKIKYLILVILFILTISLIFSEFNIVYSLSQYGSNGEEVKQIQSKLKQWGYYNGAIDGIYGSKTYNAVRNFQSKNGLTVDGVARNTDIVSSWNKF